MIFRYFVKIRYRTPNRRSRKPKSLAGTKRTASNRRPATGSTPPVAPRGGGCASCSTRSGSRAFNAAISVRGIRRCRERGHEVAALCVGTPGNRVAVSSYLCMAIPASSSRLRRTRATTSVWRPRTAGARASFLCPRALHHAPPCAKYPPEFKTKTSMRRIERCPSPPPRSRRS